MSVLCLEIATGTDPTRSLAQALADAPIPPGSALHLSVRHDAACPCLSGRSMPFCDCEIIVVELRIEAAA